MAHVSYSERHVEAAGAHRDVLTQRQVDVDVGDDVVEEAHVKDFVQLHGDVLQHVVDYGHNSHLDSSTELYTHTHTVLLLRCIFLWLTVTPGFMLIVLNRSISI